MNRKQLTIEAELTLEELRFAEDLRGIVRSNLQKVYSAINFGQVNTNWNIGRRIVEEEQHGQTRAEYGKRVIAIASQALTEEFGKGYSQTNCKNTGTRVCPDNLGNLQNKFSRQCLPNSRMNWSYYLGHTTSD